MARRDKSVEKYRELRDFDKTPEPTPGSGPQGRGAQVFVVHRHEARRLHYDLRLEMGGALCSFAVPKGFSYNPGDKHLAVHTEDHPMEYYSFHGIIPKGQYGAGTMTIWDQGTYFVKGGYDPREGVDNGKLEIILQGRKLRGEWHMVLTKRGDDEWLLFKSRDEFSHEDEEATFAVDYSSVERVPAETAFAWMTPAGQREPFTGTGWLFEMEFDGIRVVVEKTGAGGAIRAGDRDLTASCEPLRTSLAKLRAVDAVMDGVLVALDDHERPSRSLLDRCLAGDTEAPLCLYVFDLLSLEGWDLRSLSLRDRKLTLATVAHDSGSVLFVDHVETEGEQLAAAVKGAGLPGVIAKQSRSRYQAGASEDWIRIPVSDEGKARSVGVLEALEESGASKPSMRRQIRFTHRDKLYWPQAPNLPRPLTKGDLLDYYRGAAALLVPYLRDRPLHMFRHPEGIEGEAFYQKQAPSHLPSWIPTIEIPTGSSRKTIKYVVCNEVSAVMYLANLGSIDFHPWMSRVESQDSPDFCVLDLDPKSAPFFSVVKIARTIGKILRGIGLRACLKTSGSTGLHIFIPLKSGYTYDQSRMFAEAVARVTVREHPDIATVERKVEQRSGRVYVDFGQNRKGQTVVPPYVARPVPAASVSTPLDWDELNSDLNPQEFTILTALERFERVGELFRPTLEDPQDLMPAIEALDRLMREG